MKTMVDRGKKKRSDVRHACMEAAVTPELRQDIGGRRKVREKGWKVRRWKRRKRQPAKAPPFRQQIKGGRIRFLLPTRELQNQLFCPRSGCHSGLLQGYRGANQDLSVLEA